MEQETVIEKVLCILQRSMRYGSIPIPFYVDFHFTDDRFWVVVRPESEKGAPRWLRNLSLSYPEILNIVAERNDNPIPEEGGDPFNYQLNIQYAKGTPHFWNKNALNFTLRMPQYSAFRQLLQEKPVLTGRVSLPTD